MTHLLIPSRPDDTHAIVVQLALKAIGHQADIWYTADFPSKEYRSFEINHDAMRWESSSLHHRAIQETYDVVWYRRPSKPILSDALHPDDIKNAMKENQAFHQSLIQTILPHARWINPLNSIRKAHSKSLQLEVAARAGINIPHTLISNHPGHIKAFIANHHPGGYIYKTLTPLAWQEEKSVHLTYAHPISLNHLPSDDILQCTPGIFQRYIEKQFEIRVTYFSDHYIAVKIHSQLHPEATRDWRAAPTKELQLEEIKLPTPIHHACQQIMRELGIVFGCFDLIVTPEHDYFFLEVNEQGQFLWIEEVNPQIKMLDAFVAFITSQPLTQLLSLASFQEESAAIKINAMKQHVNPDLF